MIYTVTFNPSLDYIVDVQDFELHKINRTTHETILPGGKGINVSIVLKHLGLESTALGFLAGFTGREIKRLLDEECVASQFVMVSEGSSRINMKLKNIESTEINGMGPIIADRELEALFAQLEKLQENDVLVLAGNVPASVSDTIYMDVMKMFEQKGVLIVVDATKELLCNTLPYKPFLIKPNHHELEEIYHTHIETREELLFYATKLQDEGARNVLVSMGGKGAILLTEEGDSYASDVPQGTLVNAVGAGDSMVAGFLAGYIETGDYVHALKMGVATGSASAFSEELATKEEVELLLKDIFDFKDEYAILRMIKFG